MQVPGLSVSRGNGGSLPDPGSEANQNRVLETAIKRRYVRLSLSSVVGTLCHVKVMFVGKFRASFEVRRQSFAADGRRKPDRCRGCSALSPPERLATRVSVK